MDGAVTAVELPTFLSSDNLRWILLGVIAVLVLVAVLVANFVRRMVTRVAMLGLLAVVAVLVWIEWANLGDCRETCSCRLFGQDVQVPDRFGCGG